MFLVVVPTDEQNNVDRTVIGEIRVSLVASNDHRLLKYEFILSTEPILKICS